MEEEEEEGEGVGEGQGESLRGIMAMVFRTLKSVMEKEMEVSPAASFSPNFWRGKKVVEIFRFKCLAEEEAEVAEEEEEEEEEVKETDEEEEEEEELE